MYFNEEMVIVFPNKDTAELVIKDALLNNI
jgi:hypothetical protein